MSTSLIQVHFDIAACDRPRADKSELFPLLQLIVEGEGHKHWRHTLRNGAGSHVAIDLADESRSVLIV